MVKKTPFGEEKVTKPKRESHDLWNKRLRCSCGATFRKNRWHKNKNKDWSYGYQCYNQLNNGSAKKRREQGSDDSGFCDMQMIADWKLEVMCKMLMEKLWTERTGAIQEAERILKLCYQMDNDMQSEAVAIKRKIEKIKQKRNNLIDMRTEGDISIEEFRKRKENLDMELASYEVALQEQNQMKHTPQKKKLDWELIHKSLEEVIDFSKPKLDNEVVDKFIARIVPKGDNRFTWFVNLSSLKTEEIDMMVEGRRNNPTVYLANEIKEEESEDEDSSVHSNILYLSDIVQLLEEKKYSPETTQHRLQSQQRMHN